MARHKANRRRGRSSSPHPDTDSPPSQADNKPPALTPPIQTHIPRSPSAPLSRMRPLLIASIGNPPKTYTNTLHSAGHSVLHALRTLLSAPPPHRDRAYPHGLISHLHDHPTPVSLYESSAYMNESGPGVASAWKTFKARHASASALALPQGKMKEPDFGPQLVVLHDELELPVGRFALKLHAPGRSARGHNGLKSILAQQGMRDQGFWKVGVGIGPRPASRESGVVADFVLRRMSARERGRVEASAALVWQELRWKVVGDRG